MKTLVPKTVDEQLGDEHRAEVRAEYERRQEAEVRRILVHLEEKDRRRR